ncbi:hypothetical protein DFH09DRAFT_1203257 [Mycena vulgaris]|nr:hypothetical protein DFH09DRAFT_1203257 [Mycena vulgaris]
MSTLPDATLAREFSSAPSQETFRSFKAPSQSKVDWLASSLTTAKAVSVAAESISVSYVKPVFGMAVIILETIEKGKKNRDGLKELCESVTEIIRIVQGQLSSHADTNAVQFKGLCADLEGVLESILDVVKQLNKEPRGISDHFKELMNLSSTAEQISSLNARIEELKSNFLVAAAIDNNLNLQQFMAEIRPNISSTQFTHSISKCPPPSRIFHGRQAILDQMHQFFTPALGKQHIFLLYGLGGAGKTQIALKFIEECRSRFSDIFLIDTSSLQTIDTSLKDIASTRGGTTAEDTAHWLTSKKDEWLLLFDNADDPKINLNKFLPQCNHGNILITSRNPDLVVYAGSHCLVSDMEKPDAVELLLKSAGKEITLGNRQIAVEIVKALGYLPLAIVHAGAFISKSGALNSYLKLYTENRDRLLSEMPAQSHDDYRRTVYTTWQISFDQLSAPAAALLQLCSLLYREGMSEEIFARAARYQFKHGISGEEFQEPLQFLSQFLGPAGVWDSFRFMEVLHELRAYSLITLDPETKLFSIHPLVHSWRQSTLKDGSYRYQLTIIMGMSIASIPGDDLEVVSLKLLPHIDSLIMGNTNVSPHFLTQYGLAYSQTSRYYDAEPIQVAALEHHQKIRGDDHADTVDAMNNLAITYHELGRFEEAEELKIRVLDKRSKLLGDDHPDTMRVIPSLAWTYHCLGQFQKAAELQAEVLERQRKILGEDHPDTLQTMTDMMVTYTELGRLQESEEIGLFVLEKRKKITGVDHPSTLHVMSFLATTYSHLGRLKEAEELYVAVLQKRRKILGETHRHTLHVMFNLASTYSSSDQLKEAEELFVELLAKQRVVWGNDARDTLETMNNLALTYYNLDQFSEAEKLYHELLDRQTTLLGADHPHTLATMWWLAASYYYLDLTKAEKLYIELMERQKVSLGADHPDILVTLENLALIRKAMAHPGKSDASEHHHMFHKLFHSATDYLKNSMSLS